MARIESNRNGNGNVNKHHKEMFSHVFQHFIPALSCNRLQLNAGNKYGKNKNTKTNKNKCIQKTFIDILNKNI